jgi:hypothetical protein
MRSGFILWTKCEKTIVCLIAFLSILKNIFFTTLVQFTSYSIGKMNAFNILIAFIFKIELKQT